MARQDVEYALRTAEAAVKRIGARPAGKLAPCIQAAQKAAEELGVEIRLESLQDILDAALAAEEKKRREAEAEARREAQRPQLPQEGHYVLLRGPD